MAADDLATPRAEVMSHGIDLVIKNYCIPPHSKG